jgi:hypothetical protein
LVADPARFFAEDPRSAAIGGDLAALQQKPPRKPQSALRACLQASKSAA